MKKEKTISISEIKHNNRRMILEYLRKRHTLSRTDIVYDLHISFPTVIQNLQYLTELGVVDDSKRISNTGGRNAVAYTFLQNAKLAIGVDVAEFRIKAVLVNLAGEVVDIIRRDKKFCMEDDYLREIGRVVDEMVEKHQISADRLLGVGIAVPGIVDEEGEYVVYGGTMNFTGARKEQFTRYIKYPSRLLHDVYAAGCAEAWGNPEDDDVFYIMLNNTIGGSFRTGDSLYVGDTGKSGEIGHTMVETHEGRTCYCGRRGCLEVYCNAVQLAKHTDGKLDTFFDGIRNGDSRMEEILDEYLRYLAVAINNVRLLFNCKIVVGGYVGAYMELFKEKLIEHVNGLNPFGEDAAEYLLSCKYKVESTAAGAGIVFIDEYLYNI